MEPQNITDISVEPQECTIYRVHSHLRNVNDKAYEPEIISIGPYHRGKDNLKMLEEHKLRYRHLLLGNNENSFQDFISIIRREEQKARNCYAEPINLNATEFTEMMVLDGIFIIELVRKYFYMPPLIEKNDPIFNMGWILNSLQRDLMLFENQIPFFILLKLFDLVEAPCKHNKLMYLFSYFFDNVYPGKVSRYSPRSIPKSPDMIKHLLDFVHCDWFTSSDMLSDAKDTKDVRKIWQYINKLVNCDWFPSICDQSSDGEDTEDVRKSWQFINNATALTEANVKFRTNERVTTLIDVRFEKGTMLLAPITIEDSSESILRSLIAYEQYFSDAQSSFMTNYMTLMDSLINSSRDVEILSRLGIINNWLGDDKVVAEMFNKLGDSVTISHPFPYGGIFEDVNIHCRRKRNSWMAKLRSNYLNSPWAIISIIVAFIIVILTITQTVCSILQVV